MELTLQKSLSRLYIKSFTGKSFIIAEDEYHTNIIIDDKIKRWNINKSELFNFENYDKIILSKPDIIIIGVRLVSLIFLSIPILLYLFLH